MGHISDDLFTILKGHTYALLVCLTSIDSSISIIFGWKIQTVLLTPPLANDQNYEF